MVPVSEGEKPRVSGLVQQLIYGTHAVYDALPVGWLRLPVPFEFMPLVSVLYWLWELLKAANTAWWPV